MLHDFQIFTTTSAEDFFLPVPRNFCCSRWRWGGGSGGSITVRDWIMITRSYAFKSSGSISFVIGSWSLAEQQLSFCETKSTGLNRNSLFRFLFGEVTHSKKDLQTILKLIEFYQMQMHVTIFHYTRVTLYSVT